MKNINLFEKEGLVIVQNIFKKKKIQNLRNSLEKSFKNKNNPQILNIFELDNMHEILHELYLDEILIKKIYSIFDKEKYGEIYILPPFQIMRNFLPKLSSHTWHIDASGEYRYRYSKERIYSKNYLFGKVGIYLQKNTEFGGQIDVIKKTNLIYGKNNFVSLIKKNFMKFKMKIVKSMNSKLKNKYEKKILDYERLQLDVGDIAIFDSRLYHRGSPISSQLNDKVFKSQGHYVDELNDKNNKFAIYFQFGNHLGLESYWHDRRQRIGGEEEKNCWDETKNAIINSFKIKKKSLPDNIRKSLEKIDLLIH